MAVPVHVGDQPLIQGWITLIRNNVIGLPIRAITETAIEGFSLSPSADGRPEGPFGEWTGYYASGSRVEPVIHVKAIYQSYNKSGSRLIL
jgi:UbiD family decarboxylase